MFFVVMMGRFLWLALTAFRGMTLLFLVEFDRFPNSFVVIQPTSGGSAENHSVLTEGCLDCCDGPKHALERTMLQARACGRMPFPPARDQRGQGMEHPGTA